MHAPPGRIEGDPRLACVQCWLLVHTMGPSASGAPPSAPLPPPLPEEHVEGAPAATHASSVAISAALAGVAGAGGIGLAGSFIRLTQTSTTRCEGAVTEGAIKFA